MTESVRLDKWLWAARFYKTRGLAGQSVTGGKVQLNGVRIKPARALKVGDQLQIHRDGYEYQLQVLALSDRRGPASKAQLLYEESEQSIQKREVLREQHRLAAVVSPRPTSKPDKKARRQLRDMKW